MLNALPSKPVYLACGSTDLRKSIDGLAALVQEGLGLNPFSSALFVFCKGLFIVNIMLGSIGMATTLSLVSSIAARAQNNQTLVAILGLPLLIPVLLMSIKISKNALDGLPWSSSYNELAVIGSIDAIVCSLAIILFPYIWRS
jgi:ABC-type transport system involved in cytochrome c biogenesis permease component